MATTLSDIVESAEPTKVASGFVFTEGPLWHSDGVLTFVDIRRSQIIRLGTDGKTESIRARSGASNGLTFAWPRRRAKGCGRKPKPAAGAN